MTEPLCYKGRPVPYVSAWSNEHLPHPGILPARDGIQLFDHPRDSTGVSWQPWALRHGDGTPEYGTVHGPRQRRAIRKLLCQVCGGPADRDEQGVLWLLEDHRGKEPGWPEQEVTTHPPMCLPCVPLAVRLCPHLRGNAVAVRVRDTVVDGVYGQMYHRGTPLPVRGEREVVFTGDRRMRWMVGAQLAATLTGCTIVDLAELSVEAPAGLGR